MIPATQGAAAWFASLFGGTGMPTTTSLPAADSPQEWTSFAAFLQNGMGSSFTAPATLPETTDESDETDDVEASDLLTSTVTLASEVPTERTALAEATGPNVDGDATPTEFPADDVDTLEVTMEAPETTSTVGSVDAGTETTGSNEPSIAVDAPRIVETPESTTEGHASQVGTTARTTKPETSGAEQHHDTTHMRPESIAWDEAPVLEQRDVATERAALEIEDSARDDKAHTLEAGSMEGRTSSDDRDLLANETARTSDRANEIAWATTATSATESAMTSAAGAPDRPATETPNPERPVTIETGVAAKAPVSETASTTTDDAATTQDAAREALARMQVTRKESGSTNDGAWARDLGARIAVREATVPTTVSDGVADDEGPMQAEAPRESITETIVDEILEDEAAHDAGGVDPLSTRADTKVAHDDETRVRTRNSATPLPETTTASAPVAPAEAPEATSPAATMSKVDLGDRLRQAIIETLAAEAKDELLASATQGGWEGKVTVDPVSLGRVDVQVTQTQRGLEILLVTAHEEAARALDAEVDDLVDELVRRDFEPSKVTVRTHEGGHDGDRNPRNAHDPANARSRERGADEPAEDEQNERGNRGRDRQAMREREAQG